MPAFKVTVSVDVSDPVAVDVGTTVIDGAGVTVMAHLLAWLENNLGGRGRAAPGSELGQRRGAGAEEEGRGGRGRERESVCVYVCVCR